MKRGKSYSEKPGKGRSGLAKIIRKQQQTPVGPGANVPHKNPFSPSNRRGGKSRK